MTVSLDEAFDCYERSKSAMSKEPLFDFDPKTYKFIEIKNSNYNIVTTYDRILQIISDCKIDFREHYKEITSKIAYEQYACGGECLHRGYYCPSLVTDIIVGNINRGELLKIMPSESKPTYKFGFDSDNKLIFVKGPYSYEFIFHKGQYEIGISVDKYMRIKAVSECQYKDGRIDSYVYCSYNGHEKYINELDEQKYEYLENQMCVTYTGIYSYKGKRVLKSTVKDIFSVENGYLTSYIVQDIDRQGNVKIRFGDHVFKVDIERKI